MFRILCADITAEEHVEGIASGRSYPMIKCTLMRGQASIHPPLRFIDSCLLTKTLFGLLKRNFLKLLAFI